MEMDSEERVRLTEADLEVRSVQLEIMTQRVTDCEERVNSALEKINFNFGGNAPMVQCPLDPRHYVPLASKPKHLETCKYIKEGIGSEEIKEFGIQADCKGLVLIPNRLEKDILSRVRGSKPSESMEILQGILEERESQDQTSLNAELKASLHYSHEALQQRCTPQERSALYDYAIMSNRRTDPDILAGPPDPFERLNLSGRKGEKESDKIKGMRDSKRRRKTYKGGKGIRLSSLREETKSLVDLYMSNFGGEERSSSGSESGGNGEKRRKRECAKHKHKYKKFKKHRKK